MASANDVTDEEQRCALEREAQLVKLVVAAKEMCEIRPTLHATRNTAYRMKHDLTFELLLCRLRRNDKDTVEVNSRGFPSGYGDPLGNALLQNTVVTTLLLTADNFRHDHQSAFLVAQPLRDFLATSSSLVNVRVCYNDRNATARVANQIADYLFSTVYASNVIQNFSLRDRPVPPLVFKSLMTKPKSLRELDVQFANQHHRWTDEDKRCVTEGIKSNQNRLQRLSLHVDADKFDDIRNEEGTMAAHVLKNLYLVQSLQALHLEFDEYFSRMESERSVLEIFSALEHYLQSVDSLRQLQVGFILMYKTLMTKLLSGLGQTTAGVQRIAVSEVRFSACSFDAESLDLLFAFLQTPTKDENDTTVFKSALHKLSFGVHNYFAPLSNEQKQLFWKSMAESLLMGSGTTSSGKVQTVGSQIEELYTDDVHESFLHHVNINAGRFCVKHLGLHGQVPDTISTYLPKLTSVTSLSLKCFSDHSRCAVFEGIKHSGSITSVSSGHAAVDPFNPTDWHGPGHFQEFDEKQQRLINAYVQRNKFLSEYCIGQTPTTNDNYGTTDLVPIDVPNSDCGPLQVEVSQLPSILRTAMIGPGVSHLVGGLLKGDEGFGSDQDDCEEMVMAAADSMMKKHQGAPHPRTGRCQ